jgi:hypothetical protein
MPAACHYAVLVDAPYEDKKEGRLPYCHKLISDTGYRCVHNFIAQGLL